jgi:hypothetical protein
MKGYERDPACCMSLIGSERTIDMVFSSSSEREAMFQLFSLLIKSIQQKAREKVRTYTHISLSLASIYRSHILLKLKQHPS